MAVDGGIMAAATVSLGQSVSAYSFFLPPLREVRQASVNNSTMRGDVRMGQFAAGVVSVGVGVMLSYLVGSAIPAVVSILTALMVGVIYETALGGERIFE